MGLKSIVLGLSAAITLGLSTPAYSSETLYNVPSHTSRYEQIVIGHDIWGKQEYKDPSTGEAKGITVDITKKVLEGMGASDYVFVEMPWKRAIHQLEDGELDILLAGHKTVDRMSRGIGFSELPASCAYWMLVTTNALKKTYSERELLEEGIVGRPIGYDVPQELRDQYPEIANYREETVNNEQLVGMVSLERFLLVMLEQGTYEKFKDEYDLVALDFKAEEPVYILFSPFIDLKYGASFMEEFNKEMKTLKENGGIRKIQEDDYTHICK